MEKGSRRITLRTSKGQYGVDEEDPRVATLLSMYDLHGVPEVIELFGSVGEIVDEGFALFERCESNPWDRELAHLVVTEALSRKPIVERKRYASPPTLILSDLGRVRGVFDIEKDSLLFDHVLVDSRSSKEERMAHYSRVQVNRIRPSLAHHWLKYTYPGRLFVLMAERLTRCGRHEEPRILINILYNASLLAYHSSCLVEEALIWEDLSFASIEGDGTLSLFIGEKIEYPLLPWDGYQTLGEEVRFLLERLLRQLPEDVRPNQLGLGVLVDHRWAYSERVRHSVMGIASYLISSTLSAMELFNWTMAKLVEHIGEYAARRLILSITNERKRCSVARELESFAEGLERVLG